MRIKARLNLSSYVSLGMVLFMIPFLAWSFRELSRGDQNSNLTAELEKVAFERTVLRDEFVMIGGKRPRIQWELKSEEFRRLLGQARERFTKAENRALLEEIENNFNATVTIFQAIVKNREKGTGAGENRILLSETEKRLVSRNVVKAYALKDSIGLLHKSAHETATLAHERVILFLIIFAFIMIISSVGNSSVVNGILMKRLAKLHEGTGIIGTGNFNHRIDIKGSDELWDLARAVNEMAAQLKQSYTSIENLNRETEERKRAEEELKKYQEHLEELVKKRTAELEGAVGDLHFEIATRKIIEAALKKSEEKYRYLYDSMKDGIVMVDMAGKILECNAAYRAMLGYSEEEIRNLTYQALTPEKWHQMQDAILEKQILPRGYSDEYEKEYIRKSGEVFPIILKKWLIKDEKGEPRGMWAVVRDNTEKKRAEKEIAKLNEELKKQVRELEEANKELGSFNYSVSHDLKAPLRGIDGFSKIILDEYGDKLDPEGKRFLEIIRNNVTKMNRLIDDLLSFSHIGRRALSPKPIRMKTMAQEAFQELTSVPLKENVRLNVKPLPEAYADQPTICQVFINLLSNAIKFSRPRNMAEIEIGGWSADGENVYYVKDNGVGFDMTYVEKLFGIFQRLHAEAEFEGTGVGLAIVQRIIHRHGGRVWAEGKVNEGAIFYFTLPKDPKETGVI